MNYYLTKCYHGNSNAGNKAKRDIEEILKRMGFCPVGIATDGNRKALWAFLLNVLGVCSLLFVIRKGDRVVIQYPYKKFYVLACRLVHLKGGEVITVIHDLGAFRRKRMTVAKEVSRLNKSDRLVVHNDSMKEWLYGNGVTRPMECIEVFDYLSATENREHRDWTGREIKVMYAGALSYRKNKYLYELSSVMKGWGFELYGNGFESNRIADNADFHYHGFVPSEDLIAHCKAHLGLIWEGDSLVTCQDDFGEYLRLNNPHKLSLYIRCGMPVIIWKEAALASFVTKHRIGLVVGSLMELNDLLPVITASQYEEMKSNVLRVGGLLQSGHYIRKAVGAYVLE